MTKLLARKLADLIDKAIPYMVWYARRLRSQQHAYRLIEWEQKDPRGQLLYEHSLKADSVFIDLGGFRGDFSSEILARYQCRSLIFEPVPIYADNIRKRLINNEKAEIFDMGLAAETSTMTLNVDGERTSLYKSDGQEIHATLLQFGQSMRENRVEHIDLLKINIEGGEYDLLDWLTTSDWIHRVDRLLVQFHDFVPDAQARRAQLVEALGQTHEPYFSVPFIWEGWTRRASQANNTTHQSDLSSVSKSA